MDSSLNKIFFIVVIVMLVTGCEEGGETADSVGDDFSDANTASESSSCPESCDDANDCTTDSCSIDTGFECLHEDIVPCCGNSVCEESEYPDCPDCTICEELPCKTASFDYEKQFCIYENIVPCCGNSVCEEGETHISCSGDCEECASSKDCFESVYDFSLQACREKPITPCCGNNICDRGESCTSCADDCECEEGTDLSDYPEFFDDSTLIVVGEKAKSLDSLTAAKMTTALYTQGIETEANLYTGFTSGELASNDLIVLGRPCENSLWEEYQGIECEVDNYFEPGTALVKLIINNGREILYIGGYSPEDTEKAVDYVMQSKSLSGMETELDTSGSSAKKI